VGFISHFFFFAQSSLHVKQVCALDKLPTFFFIPLLFSINLVSLSILLSSLEAFSSVASFQSFSIPNKLNDKACASYCDSKFTYVDGISITVSPHEISLADVLLPKTSYLFEK
jgi:hypothetical protein